MNDITKHLGKAADKSSDKPADKPAAEEVKQTDKPAAETIPTQANKDAAEALTKPTGKAEYQAVLHAIMCPQTKVRVPSNRSIILEKAKVSSYLRSQIPKYITETEIEL